MAKKKATKDSPRMHLGGNKFPIIEFHDTQRHPFAPGTAWFFRTATYHLVGRVRRVFDLGVELEFASHVGWPSARHMDVVVNHQLSDTEPVPDGHFVAFGGLIDASPWTGELGRVRL